MEPKCFTDFLTYNPHDGTFTWKVTRGKAVKGRPAGYVSKRGYIQIGVGRRLYLAHRLAWFFTYGGWPSKNVDHRDGDPTNNAISNLRLANQMENTNNSKLGKNNKSGYKGVCWDTRNRCWLAHLKHNYKHVLFKRFKKIGDAVEAVESARKLHHKEFARSV